MSELDAFEAKVRNNIKLLSSSNAAERRKAVIWLGEAGDPSAIRKLRSLYQSDPDPKVRSAAADSLGMFRALEQGMKREDNEFVYDLLEDIALRGKMGKRVGIPIPVLSRLLFGLLVSLVILLAFNFLVWPQYGAQIEAALVPASASTDGGPSTETVPTASSGDTAPAPDRETLLAELNSRASALRQDAQTLQAIYLDFANLNCETSFVSPTAYAVNDDATLAAIAARLNGQILDLATAKAPYNQACASETPALTVDQVAAPLTTLQSILTALDSIEADLNAAAAG